MAKKRISEKYILITNLAYVTVNGVRTKTHALLLAHQAHPFDEATVQCVARGFSVDPTSPTFDMVIPSIDYEFVTGESRNIMIAGDGDVAPKPLFTGGIMRVLGKEPVEIQLISCDDDQAIEFTVFEKPTARDRQLILDVWDVLPGKVATYWRAPNMPTTTYMPADYVRAQYGVRGKS